MMTKKFEKIEKIIECAICGTPRVAATEPVNRCRDCGLVFFWCCPTTNRFTCRAGGFTHHLAPLFSLRLPACLPASG